MRLSFFKMENKNIIVWNNKLEQMKICSCLLHCDLLIQWEKSLNYLIWIQVEIYSSFRKFTCYVMWIFYPLNFTLASRIFEHFCINFRNVNGCLRQSPLYCFNLSETFWRGRYKKGSPSLLFLLFKRSSIHFLINSWSNSYSILFILHPYISRFCTVGNIRENTSRISWD